MIKLEDLSQKVVNILQSKDVRKRVIFTLSILVLYRFGSHIRVPGIDQERLKLLWQNLQSSLVGVLDLFSGGNLKVISVFALGITPYITSSIVIQLLTVAIPSLKRLQEEGDVGRRKLNQYTRYLTVCLSVLQSIAISTWIYSQPGLTNVPANLFIPLSVLSLTAGTSLVMWMGEQITDRGVGNGISLLIFAGIIVRMPSLLTQLFGNVASDPISAVETLVLLVLFIILTAVIVFVEKAYRPIPIGYARRRNESLEAQSYLPLKINMSGVIPVIFASSLLAFPVTIAQFSGMEGTLIELLNKYLRPSHPLYELLFTAGIIFFSFFYVSVIFDVQEVSNNLRKYGSYVPGIRPGKTTAEYLDVITARLTLVGALYLATVCFVPQFLASGLDVAEIPILGEWLYSSVSSNPALAWMVKGFGYSFYFGGTSLLIAVSVSMDTAQQIDAHLLMKKYDLAQGGVRVRGRRFRQEASNGY